MKTSIAALVLAALALGAVLFLGPEPVVETPLGAVSGPDSSFPCESHNGVTRCFATMGMRVGTTTTCSLKSPNASSTLVTSQARFIIASSSAALVEMGRASDNGATTTLLARQNFAAGAGGSLIATTSATALTDGIVAPNSFINVRITGAGGATAATAPTGVCQATFEVF